MVVREETPSPLHVGFPADGLPEFPRENRLVEALGYRLILLLSNGGGPALPGDPFRLGFPYQDRVETPLLEVHLLSQPGPDLLGPMNAQRLRKNDVGKDEGSLGVPTPAENPLPFRGQNCCEAAPHRSGGRGIPSRRLSSEPAPTTLP